MAVRFGTIVLCEFAVCGGVLHSVLAPLLLQVQLQVFHSFSNSAMLLCRGLLCAVHFPPTSSLFTCMSFCSAPVLHFLRLRLLLPFVKGVRVTSSREGCLCLLLCRLSLLSLEPCRNSRGETACPTLFTSGGVCCPLFKV